MEFDDNNNFFCFGPEISFLSLYKILLKLFNLIVASFCFGKLVKILAKCFLSAERELLLKLGFIRINFDYYIQVFYFTSINFFHYKTRFKKFDWIVTYVKNLYYNLIAYVNNFF